MASKKKNRPSTPNGNPSTAPYRRISPGHSRPSSNDSTVPVTAPTATSTPIAWDQRRASNSATASDRRSPTNSASSTIVGNAIPRQAKMMWNPKVAAICARAETTSPPLRAAATITTSAKRIAPPGPRGYSTPIRASRQLVPKLVTPTEPSAATAAGRAGMFPQTRH